jgi:hypothetical protein
MSASYEKVIKVKADVAASSYFSYIADPGVVGGELSRAELSGNVHLDP